jgi:hypothetical protein
MSLSGCPAIPARRESGQPHPANPLRFNLLAQRVSCFRFSGLDLRGPLGLSPAVKKGRENGTSADRTPGDDRKFITPGS